MKRLLLSLLLIIPFAFTSQASHLLGGEITWKCQPNGQFSFTLIIYRECGSGAAGVPQNTQTIQSNSPAGSFTATRTIQEDVSPQCNNSSIACNTSPSGNGAMERNVYVANNVTLNGVPPATGWYFSWGPTCCRPGGVTNLQVPSSSQQYVLRAFMFPYNAGAGNQNTFPCYDSSPYFLEPPNVVTCTGYDIIYNNFGFDEDLDSIYYDWAQPLKDGPAPNWNPVDWAAGYTYDAPFPGTTSFDQETGQIIISGTNLTGVFVSCIKVEAWRCGNNNMQKIAEVFREVPITILNAQQGCTLTNSPPDMAISNYAGFPPVAPVTTDSLLWEVIVMAGETVKFRVGATDYDMNPGFVFQEIDFFAAGGNLGNPWDNPTNCLFNPPCATLTSLNTGNSYTSTLVNEVDFEWTTNCANLSFTAFLCGVPQNTYNFYFRMQDNACPAPAFSIRTIRVVVVSFESQPPNLSQSCVIRDSLSNEVDFDWTIPADTGNNFDYYIVYRSTGGPNGPFTPYDTIYNYLDDQYTDASAPNGPAWYYVTHRGGCSYESEPSDTISTIWMTLNSLPPSSPYAAELSWNRMHSPDTVIPYEVWRFIPNSGWSLLATTTDTTFTDTVTLCGANIDYQIRVNNQCLSNIDGDFFADQINNDRLIIDSISVVNSETVISWQPTGEGDVVEYIILMYVQGQGWIPQDTVPVGFGMPYTFLNGNPDQERQQMKIVSLDSCGNMSSDQLTLMHNNMHLRTNLDACNATIRLNWNTYKNWPGGVQQYEVYVDEIDNNGIATDGILLATYGPDDSTHVVAGLRSGYEYCYYVRARDTSGTATSTSNRKCIDAIVTQPSNFLYLGKADIRPSGAVDLKFYYDGDADVKHFLLQRSEEEDGLFSTLIEVDRPATPPNEVSYTDYSAEPGLSYYYRVVSIDSCDTKDTTSNYLRTMHLMVNTKGNMSNTLVWTPFKYYDQGVAYYEVYRQQKGDPNFELITNQVSGLDSVYVDDIRPKAEGSGKFCYYVRAVEEPNQWGFLDNGQTLASRSVQACAVQEARVFIPSAFNPTSDVEENRVFKPSNVFHKEGSYTMSVTNRWGQEVFNTDDPTEPWDGTYNGEPQPTGVYIYFIRYQSEDDVPIERRGSVTLLW